MLRVGCWRIKYLFDSAMIPAGDSMSNTNEQRAVFWTVVAITASCGFAALALAIVPLFVADSLTRSPFLDPMFKLLTYLFAGGVGAIFGMIGVRDAKS